MSKMNKIFSVCESRNKKHIELCFLGIKLKLKKRKKQITLDDIKKIHEYYHKLEKILSSEYKNGKKIKVAFFVSLASMFPAKTLMKKFLANSKYKVSLIVLPDFRFDIDKVISNQKRTIEELSEFKDIMHIVPLEENEDNLNIKEIADIVFPALPYDVSHVKYDLENLIKSDILTALVNYGFYRSIYDRSLISEPRNSLYWKIFAETELNVVEYKNFQMLKGENVVLSGYSKMDAYSETKLITNNKKTVMIAPHHSIEGGFNDTLGLSNFYNYSDLFLNLPKMYPDINFIFRPHPALFLLLANKKYWGAKKVDEYLNNMCSNQNVEYSIKGDYFTDFAKSDAIIQDCGSYLVEYFYTLKPHCYMLKSEKDIKEKFTPLGKKCLENCYIAYDEKSILKFIDEVVLEEIDIKKQQREKFSKEVVMHNYPNASEKIVQCIENCLEIRQ